MTLITYPLDDCDYSADDAALFHCTRTSGIFASDDFSFSVSGADNTVRIGPGIAWMRINKFKGLVAALKNEVSVDLGLPDSVYSRIDRVVLQYNANTRDTTVVVKSGVARSNPMPPERSTEEALYELHLLEVLRKPAAASVKPENVTDLRFDSGCCGLMADSVTRVDTTAINAQVMALIASLREEIDAVKAGTAYVMKSGDAMTGNLSIPAPTADAHAANKAYVDAKRFTASAALGTGWSASAPYTQTVPVPGLLETDIPHVAPVYDPDPAAAMAQREAWAMVCQAVAGTDSLTFTCFENCPGAAVPIQIEVMR